MSQTNAALECDVLKHVKNGNLEYFEKELTPTQLRNFKDNNKKNTILHLVADYGNLELLKFILQYNDSTSEFKKWCKLQNNDGETALLKATIKEGNHDAVNLLLNADYKHKLQLRRLDNKDGDTPLHLAVESQNLQMVELLVRDKLDFEYCPNEKGNTPLWLAIRKARSSGSEDDNSVTIIKLILDQQPEQMKVRIGDKSWSLLHFAAYKGDLGVARDIIRLRPDCVDILDSEGWNLFHTAAKYGQIQLVKHFLNANEFSVVKYLNAQDNNGNTPLHIAALTGNEPLCQCFLYDPRVIKTTINSNGQKVLDVINFDYDKRRAGIYGIRDRMNEKDLVNQSNVGLVVGTLIATVSFIAGITVPGGHISEGQNLCVLMFSKSSSLEVFVISNNFALIFSLFGVFNNLCASYLHEREDIVYKLNVASICSVGAMLAMMIAFMTGSYAVLAISNRIAITICVTSSFFFIFVSLAILGIWMKKRCYHLSFPKPKYRWYM